MTFDWSRDIDQARWWADVLHPFGQDVGSVIADVFPAYARVFHPVDEAGIRRTWADVAAENGRIVHPEMQFHEITRALGEPRPQSYDMDSRVGWGSLPARELEVLAELLARHTTTPGRCWCCVWEGYGQLHGGAAVAGLTSDGVHGPAMPIAPSGVLGGPRVSVPGRGYHLLYGPLADLGDLFDHLGHQSPNLWWPDDRAWCVSTEVDFAWTYVGGSDTAINAVLSDPRLEALPAKPTDRFTYGSDVRNAALDEQ